MTPLCISVPEAAKALGISKTHAYELAHAGELPTLQLGARRIVVPLAALKRMVAQASAPLEDSLPGADRSPDPNSPGEQSSAVGPHRDTAVGRAGHDDENERSAATG